MQFRFRIAICRSDNYVWSIIPDNICSHRTYQWNTIKANFLSTHLDPKRVHLATAAMTRRPHKKPFNLNPVIKVTPFLHILYAHVHTDEIRVQKRTGDAREAMHRVVMQAVHNERVTASMNNERRRLRPTLPQWWWWWWLVWRHEGKDIPVVAADLWAAITPRLHRKGEGFLYWRCFSFEMCWIFLMLCYRKYGTYLWLVLWKVMKFLNWFQSIVNFLLQFFYTMRKGVNNAMRHAHTSDEISTRIIS